MEIDACELFRVTRNANTERDEEEADDLLAMIESELRDRRLAPIVRLEVLQGMDPVHRGMLAAELGLDEHSDAVRRRRHARHARLDGDRRPRGARPCATRPTGPSTTRVFSRRATSSTSSATPARILLQHPYESFSTSVERFLREASEDPKVRAIKMTFYRTSAESNVIDYLLRGGPQRQTGRGRRRAEGALRRGRQHPVRQPPGGLRHPRHLRRRRAEDALQGHPRGPPGLQRPAPLRPHRNRQLPRRYGAHLHRLRPAHLATTASARISRSCSIT